MKRDSHPVKHPDLNGSEQHHDLKNQPGRAEEPDASETRDELTEDVEKTVSNSDADTSMADALRDATPNSEQNSR